MFPDSSFDAVVITLVLCSVHDTAATLSEVRRVLKPGGKLYFMEHVVAEWGTLLWMAQQVIYGSNPDRDRRFAAFRAADLWKQFGSALGSRREA